jgi:hypothetical protein
VSCVTYVSWRTGNQRGKRVSNQHRSSFFPPPSRTLFFRNMATGSKTCYYQEWLLSNCLCLSEHDISPTGQWSSELLFWERKGKLVHTMKAYRESGGVAPPILNLGSRSTREWPASCSGHFYWEEDPQLQLNKSAWSVPFGKDKCLALARNIIWDNPFHNPFVIPAVLSLVLLLFIYLFVFTFTTRHRISCCEGLPPCQPCVIRNVL